MVAEHLFRGNALNAVDAKGRLSVPAFIRQKIERRSDAKLIVLAPHEAFPCLIGYDDNFDAEIHRENERRRLLEEGSDPAAHFARVHRTFSAAEEASYDSSGRISLPPRMRQKSGIEDLVLFVGAGATFEVWNPHRALEHGDDELKDIAAYWLNERGAS